MKGQAEFWLPLPPSLVHVANSSIIDWRALVTAEHGIGHKDSNWAFASTRRIDRNLRVPDDRESPIPDYRDHPFQGIVITISRGS